MYKIVLLRHGESAWNKENRFAGWTDIGLTDAGRDEALRAFIKYLDNISDQDIVGLNIPTAIPLVYELNADLRPVRHYYLGDQAAVEAAVKAVASQGKARA